MSSTEGGGVLDVPAQTCWKRGVGVASLVACDGTWLPFRSLPAVQLLSYNTGWDIRALDQHYLAELRRGREALRTEVVVFSVVL